MENDILFQEKLRMYTAGEMPPGLAKAFLEEAMASPAKQKELAFSEQLVAALRFREAAAVENIVKDIINSEGLPSGRNPWSFKWWIIFGLAALVTMAFFTVVWVGGRFSSVSSPNASLIDPYLTPLENIFGLDSQSDSALIVGITAYQQKAYKKSAAALENYLQQHSELNVTLYLGTAYLLDGQFEAAIQKLEFAALSNEPPIRETALWYAALAYLSNGKKEKAVFILNQIAPQALYYSEAQALLQKINFPN